tara:strand:- start:230 stop:670 length:441 start_codon:yes stop_codon:yes gene_type:complete
MRKQVAVEDGLFSWTTEGVRLIGGRCMDCKNHVFPHQPGCPKCGSAEVEKVELGTEGELWTWTIQGYPPKAPPYIGEIGEDDFEAFGVGYVELSEEVRVEARLTENDPSRLRIGMPMKLVLVPLTVNDLGEEVMTFAFAPKGSSNE